jgi:hypothetical protein
LLHNSLFVRDELREKNNNPFSKERRDPHRNVRRDPRRRPGAGEMELTGEWCVTVGQAATGRGKSGQVALERAASGWGKSGRGAQERDESGQEMPVRVAVEPSTGALGTESLGMESFTAAAEDLRDFLVRMGVSVSPLATGEIRLQSDSGVEPGSFSLTVEIGRISVNAVDAAGLWAGVVYLEKEMGVRCAPIVPFGRTSRQPLWRMQIGQAPYGANFLVPDLSPEYLSDDAFRGDWREAG